MKKVLFLTITLFVNSIIYAQYSTPGTMVSWNIDSLVEHSGGVVSFDSGTYFINQDLTISSTDTLKIITDNTVKLASNVLITIEGVLYADALNRTTFTAIDTTANFKGFKFDNSSASVLRNCTIEFGGGIKLIDTDMIIDNCIIRNNNYSNCYGAIDLFYSNAIISNCHIYQNKSSAISSSANGTSSPQIVNCNIHNNTSDNMNRPQINLGTSDDTDTIKIIGNTISDSYSMVGGISVATLAGGSINCVIDSNVIENNRYGISVFGSNINSVISNNTILNNNLETNPMNGGSGISFYGSSSNISTVTKNEISGNLWGVTIISSAMPNLGQISNDTVNIGMNTIFNNGNGGQVYDLYNNTSNTIMAENNFWGTFDTDTVEMHIFHQPDDSNLGIVDYLPIAEEIALSSEKKITYFAFEALDTTIVAVISERHKTISLEVPYNTEVSNLIATFTHSEYSTVFVNGVEQVSGITQNNFSDTLIYTVVAQDNSSVDYSVIVTVSPDFIESITGSNIFSIFPNPAKNSINIIIPESYQYNSIAIYDILKRNVLNIHDIRNSKIITVDISKLNEGLYFVKLISDKKTTVESFVVR